MGGNHKTIRTNWHKTNNKNGYAQCWHSRRDDDAINRKYTKHKLLSWKN